MRELVEERKRKMLAFLADGSAEEDILGAAALAQLLLGIGNEEVINARLTGIMTHAPIRRGIPEGSRILRL